MNKKGIVFLVGLLILLISVVFMINEKLKTKESFEKNYTVEKMDVSIETGNLGEKEKISPNAIIIKETEYKKCGHNIKEKEKIPQELVNLTFEELKIKIKDIYPNWIIKDFNKNEITLFRISDEECKKEYVLREKDGKVIINVKEKDKEVLLEETEIEVEYLTEIDKIKLKQGIELIGNEELNSALEDYE